MFTVKLILAFILGFLITYFLTIRNKKIDWPIFGGVFFGAVAFVSVLVDTVFLWLGLG